MRIVSLDARVPMQVESLNLDFPLGRNEFLCMIVELEVELNTKIVGYHFSFPMTPRLWSLEF